MGLGDELAAAADPEIAPHVLEALRAAPAGVPAALTELAASPRAPAALLELRRLLRSGDPTDDEKLLDTTLRETLRPMLTADTLEMRTLSADDPAAVLDQIAAGDTVQPVRDRADLRRRLDPADRRVLALTAPGRPDVLLVFVEVALTRGLAGSMPELLDGPVTEMASTADTASFYSINSCHPGAAGLRLGGLLIRDAVPVLRRALPHVDVFATLSPIPTLRHWLDREHADVRAADRPALAARYLCQVEDGRVRDPVGNFHLGNGACVERVCPDADPSAAGLERSYGIMVNYRYDPSQLDARAAAYRRGVVAASDAISGRSRRSGP